MADAKINPYNFVPLQAAGPARAAFPGWHRLASDTFSGPLHCTLEAVSPLFSADHQHTSKAPGGQTWFSFLRNSSGVPILQGTTLKGMIRAVYEAWSNACLPLTAASGTARKGRQDEPYTLTMPDAYQHATCADIQTLCAACRLFGVIQGEAVHAQGRVLFTDAVLSHGTLEAQAIKLPELSSPKPYHYAIYSKTRRQGGEIAGRKFFYHHRAPSPASPEWSTRANGMTEVAPVGTRFAFTVMLQALTASELARLVACLVLTAGLGHKVGMGKPIGFGSCRIAILPAQSALSRGGERYKDWHTAGAPVDVAAQVAQAGTLPAALREVLRLDKYCDGVLGYLPFRGYTGMGINTQGTYVPVQTGSAGETPTTSQNPAKSGVTLQQLDAMRQQLQNRGKNEAAAKKVWKKNEKLQVEVIEKDGDRYTLRVPETEEKLVHSAPYLGWQVGGRPNVRIVELGPDGRIKKIRPVV